MSAECAICYVADLNFMLPSLVSAAGVRRFITREKADIFIFSVGVDAETVKEANTLLKPLSIEVLAIDTHVFNELDKDLLTRTYTPMAMFGRLFMQELLPSSCRRIVYLDGDTWIHRDPTALVDAIIPEGKFAAAEDTIAFRQNFRFGATTGEIRKYFRQLGLAQGSGYFNSGVFATSLDTWRGIAKEAYSYYVANAEACAHSPDQSALNAIIGDRRVRLSSKWNFQTQLRIWGAEKYVEPHIYHFNRQPKPWMGESAPWREMYKLYQEAIVPFSALKLPLKTLSANEIAKSNAETEKAYSYISLPGVSWAALRAMKFSEAERKAWL